MINRALELSKRREEICKNAKPCPICNTNQVQLITYFKEVEWKCRHCKHKWKGE